MISNLNLSYTTSAETMPIHITTASPSEISSSNLPSK